MCSCCVHSPLGHMRILKAIHSTQDKQKKQQTVLYVTGLRTLLWILDYQGLVLIPLFGSGGSTLPTELSTDLSSWSYQKV